MSWLFCVHPLKNRYFFMRASKLRSMCIMLRSIGLTLAVSMQVLFFAAMQAASRQKINKCLLRWAKKLLTYLQVHYKVINPHNVTLKQGATYIIMSNHCSLYDIPLIIVAFPNKSIRMMSKKELFRVPVWGSAMRAAEILSIDRKNSRQAVKDLKIAQKKMKSGIIPWIAPEGTRSRDGKLQEFKKGGFLIAKQTGATIIPVCINGSGQILPPKSTRFGLNQRVEIYIGKPVDVKEYVGEKRNKLIPDVRAEIKKYSEL